MTETKFRRRMLLAAVLPTLIFTVVLSFIWVSWFQQELGDARTAKVEAAARHLASAAEFHLFSMDVVTLGSLLDGATAREPEIAGAAIFDRRGNMVAGTGRDLASPAGVAEATWDEQAAPGYRRLVMPIQAASLAIDDPGMEVRAAGSGDNHLVGFVVLEVSDSAWIEKRNSILAVAAILIVVAMLAGGLLAAFMSNSIVESITGIILVVQRIGRGDLAARVDPDPECVLYQLELGINQMAEQVGLSQDDMRQRIETATSELQEQKRAAEQEARLDALTRLGNRRAFMERGEAEVQRARRYGTPLSLTMFDLDLFKQINDNYGHDVGDLVLSSLADNLRRLMREVDFVARLGGEEFAILMPDTPASEAMGVAERLREAVEAMRVEVGDRTIGCTASFGVSEYAADDTRIQDVFVRADQALYRAKQSGRNRVEPG